MKTLERLAIILEKNKNKDYENKDLYRLLYKEDLYVVAYEKLKSNSSNIGLDGINKEKIEAIIKDIKTEKYKFQPAEKISFLKINRPPVDVKVGKAEDKLVLEVIRMILESIYENVFHPASHGYRANKSCHTALRDIRVVFAGTKWFLKGNIKNCFKNIEQEKLITILTKKIKDVKFLNLIRKVLNAGYFEFRTLKTSTGCNPVVGDFVGIPIGNIISPILSNIYLNELDQFVENLKKENTKGKKSGHGDESFKQNPKFVNFQQKIARVREECNEKANKMRSELWKIPSSVSQDEAYKRLNYVRYADSWLIGMASSKKEIIIIKEKVEKFLKEELNLELNIEKCQITNAGKENIEYLGVLISVPFYKEVASRSSTKIITMKRLDQVIKKRKNGGIVKMKIPLKKILLKLQSSHICDLAGKSKPKLQWLSYSHKDIILSYNNIINSLLNYYSFVDNVSVLCFILYILKSSAAKLLATKFSLGTQRKVYKKFGSYLKSPVPLLTAGQPGTMLKEREDAKINRMAFKKKVSHDIPSLYLTRYTKSLLHKICEICESTKKVEMHHVKHIRKMNHTLTPQEKSMVALKRNGLGDSSFQIAVCRECHMQIHTGKYDGVSLKDIIKNKK